MTSANKDSAPKGSPYIGPLFGFAAGLVAAIGTFASGALDRVISDRQLNIEEMRIAFDILKLPSDQGGPYRVWACEVLDSHTKPKIDCSKLEAQNESLGDFSRFGSIQLGQTDRGDPKLTDITMFTCTDGDLGAAQTLGASLRQAGFGDISFKEWTLFNEVSREELSGKVSIIYDADHDERHDLDRVRAALASVPSDRLVTIPNRADLTEWRFSIVVCDRAR